MDYSAGARTEVLRRIRAATGAAGVDAATIAAEWNGLQRDYRRVGTVQREGLLHLLEDRLRDYEAGVYRTGRAGLRALIGQILAERGKQRMAVPEGISREWLPEGITFVEDSRGDAAGAGYARIDGCEGVLTGATLAIAETGTIVLQDGPGQGRRAVTLLPDYHLCVVDAGTVVETVPEAMGRLQATAGKATTFFRAPRLRRISR